jgi:hypothetical protein
MMGLTIYHDEVCERKWFKTLTARNITSYLLRIG